MPKSKATEFFYLDDNGEKQDRKLHLPILAHGDRVRGLASEVDESIMRPIRDRHRARWLQQRVAKKDKSGDNAELRLWDEDEHPRHPAGSPLGGQFAPKGEGDGDASGAGAAGGGSEGNAAAGDRPDAPRGDDQGVHGSPQGFTRSSGRRIGGSRLLADAKTVAFYEPDAEQVEIIKQAGGTPVALHELARGQGEAYRSAILEAKVGKFGAAVTAYDAADYDQMRTFVSDDGMVGFALKGDDIVSVFKHPDGKQKQACATMLTLATGLGGRRLDCFDTQLPYLYSNLGFRAVARIPFNDEYAPEGWDYDAFGRFNGGRPDVVFMVFDPGVREYAKGDGKTVAEYDDGLAAQAVALADTTQDNYETEKLLNDGPREGMSRSGLIKDRNAYLWGSSHSNSQALTGYSATLMGIDGYRPSEGMWEKAQSFTQKLLRVINASDGVKEPLYHGFQNVRGIDWKVGDTLKLPLTATSGDEDGSAGYGMRLDPKDNKGPPTVFEFPVGTKFAGYSRWDRENAKSFGHQWGEAIVAGKFEITGTRKATAANRREYTVVSLKPLEVFDPTAKRWRAA